MNEAECPRCGDDTHNKHNCPITKQEEKEQKIKDGKAALEVAWDVFTRGPKGWRRKIIKWLWPDLSRMAAAIMDYYWAN